MVPKILTNILIFPLILASVLSPAILRVHHVLLDSHPFGN